jgi:hypothetical protein
MTAPRLFAGWKLDEQDRVRLLTRFPPIFAQIVADHVTLRSGTNASTALPTETSGEVVGEVDDGLGVQALVVRIGGTTERGDGSTFHLTWSLGEGRHAKESNDVIARYGWRPLEKPVPIRLLPAHF